MNRWIAVLAAMMMLLSGVACAQTPDVASLADEETQDDVVVPEWARHLRRAEIVAAGSFPLTLLASRLVYSLVRFAVKSIQAGAFDLTYAPRFLAPPGSPELVIGEKLAIVGGAVSLSSIIAFIDYRRGVLEDGADP